MSGRPAAVRHTLALCRVGLAGLGLVLTSIGGAAGASPVHAAGGMWAQQHPTLRPPARERAGMATGASGQSVVLFGGEGNTGLLDDTWVWDGDGWLEQHPARRPPAR